VFAKNVRRLATPTLVFNLVPLMAQSAIGTVDARHGRYPRRFGQGFEIEKPVADGTGCRVARRNFTSGRSQNRA